MDEPCAHWRPPRSLFFALPGRRCYECEAEEYTAWQASVKARLDEALLHLANGLDATWEHLPCAAYPRCVPPEGSEWLPRGWTVSVTA